MHIRGEDEEHIYTNQNNISEGCCLKPHLEVRLVSENWLRSSIQSLLAVPSENWVRDWKHGTKKKHACNLFEKLLPYFQTSAHMKWILDDILDEMNALTMGQMYNVTRIFLKGADNNKLGNSMILSHNNVT